MAIALLFTLMGFLSLYLSEQYTYTPGFNGLLLKAAAALFFMTSLFIVCINI